MTRIRTAGSLADYYYYYYYYYDDDDYYDDEYFRTYERRGVAWPGRNYIMRVLCFSFFGGD